MKIVWTHNLPSDRATRGPFMYTVLHGLARIGVTPELLSLGDLRSPASVIRGVSRVREISHDTIVHSQFGSACGLVSSIARGPKVLSLRGSDWYQIKNDFSGGALHSWAATTMTRRAIRRYDQVVVMSRRMQIEVGAIYPGSQIAVIPDPIDLESFRPIDRREARAMLGWKVGDAPVVLFACLNESNPIKRLRLARLAVDRARRVIPELRLQLITDLQYDQMPAVMNAADVFLLTSCHEGWPNVVKEALACNTPFVSTDVSDLHDIAAVEPSCAVVSADPDELAAGLLRAIRMPRSPSLRSRVADMNLHTVSEAILSVYARIN